MENVPNLRTDERTTNKSLSDVFDVLGEKRRRYVLYHLDRQEEPTPLGQLVDQIAAWENDTTAEHRNRVCTSLHHIHIPKLENAGVAAYDREANTVELFETVELLQPYLDIAARRELP